MIRLRNVKNAYFNGCRSLNESTGFMSIEGEQPSRIKLDWQRPLILRKAED
jgi:hypothetical protein